MKKKLSQLAVLVMCVTVSVSVLIGCNTAKICTKETTITVGATVITLKDTCFKFSDIKKISRTRNR